MISAGRTHNKMATLWLTFLATAMLLVSSAHAQDIQEAEYPRIQSIDLLSDHAYVCKVMPSQEKAYWEARTFDGTLLFKEKLEAPGAWCEVATGSSEAAVFWTLSWMDSYPAQQRVWTPRLEDPTTSVRLPAKWGRGLSPIYGESVIVTESCADYDFTDTSLNLIQRVSSSEWRRLGTFKTGGILFTYFSTSPCFSDRYVLLGGTTLDLNYEPGQPLDPPPFSELHLVQLEPFKHIGKLRFESLEIFAIGAVADDLTACVVASKAPSDNEWINKFIRVKVDPNDQEAPLKVQSQTDVRVEEDTDAYWFTEDFVARVVCSNAALLSEVPSKLGTVTTQRFTSDGLSAKEQIIEIPLVEYPLDPGVEFESMQESHVGLPARDMAMSNSGNTMALRESASSFVVYRYDGEQHVRVGTVSVADDGGLLVEVDG